jgi:hypothetical protein
MPSGWSLWYYHYSIRAVHRWGVGFVGDFDPFARSNVKAAETSGEEPTESTQRP